MICIVVGVNNEYRVIRFKVMKTISAGLYRCNRIVYLHYREIPAPFTVTDCEVYLLQ